MSVHAAKANLIIAAIPVDKPKRIARERKLQIFRLGSACYFQFIMVLESCSTMNFIIHSNIFKKVIDEKFFNTYPSISPEL